MSDPPVYRESLGATFKRYLRKLVLPTGHDETTGPVIVLDGSVARITIIGSNGAKTIIDANAAGVPFPQITFSSIDGTNDSWINAVSTVANPSWSDLSLTSGKYTPADAVVRRNRMILWDGNGGGGHLDVIKDSDQSRKGGYYSVFRDAAYHGFSDGTDQNIFMYGGGFATSTNLGVFTIMDDEVSGQHKYLFEFGPAATDTTTSGSMVDLKNNAGASFSVNFVKRFTATAIEVHLHASFYAGGADAGPDFGVLINGTDYLVATMNSANGSLGSRKQASGVVRVAGGLAAGTYAVKPRWRRINAAGTLTRDNNDLITVLVREVDAN